MLCVCVVYVLVTKEFNVLCPDPIDALVVWASRVAQDAYSHGMMKEAEAAVELRVKRCIEDNSGYCSGINSKERWKHSARTDRLQAGKTR